MNKLLLSGYFGFNNMGDEAILKGLIDGILREVEDPDIVVLSSNPEFTLEKYADYPVRAINRMDLVKIGREMKTADLFVSGGGSLLQDVTSSRSLLYYLGLLSLAKTVYKKKTMIYSQGIGPVNKEANKNWVRRILNKVDLINVRDKNSKKTLEDIGITRDILVTADTVLGMTPPSKEGGKKLLSEMGAVEGRTNLAISLRTWKDKDAHIEKEISFLIEKLLETGEYNIFLLPFHFNEDMKLISKIHANLGEKKKDVYVITQDLYVDDYLSFMGNMDIVVAMRLHGLIFSTLMGAVPIGISYDPKVDSFLQEIRSEDIVSVQTFASQDLYDMIRQKRETLSEEKERISIQAQALREVADVSNRRLKELLMKQV
ncbi:MAG: polysaccharide pyruvyl transferase CsaB [Filifactor alocis]|nr:polysaccharide pyruvyl transferase CsaB [Filifactor alocis]